MYLIKTVETDKDYLIKKVQFVGLKPVEPEKFAVRICIFMINDLGASLELKNWNPHGDNLYVDLEGEIPIADIPEFAISFSCFLKFENSNDDAREAVASALMKVITELPTTKVVIAKENGKVFAKLILEDTEIKGEVNPGWVDHLFETL